MEKENFLKILMHSTPEEINDFISLKGKQKMVNAITFITSPYNDNNSKGEEKNGKCQKNDK